MFILPEKEYFHIGDVVVNAGTMRTIVPFGKDFINYPINMDYVETFKPESKNYSQIDLTIYTIIFRFNSMTTETWHFETKEEREVAFKKLVRIYTGKTTPEKEKE